MPKLPGVNHLRAIKAFEKAGFEIIRQGKHISMSNGDRIIVIPRANPVNGYTMAGIINDAGLSGRVGKVFYFIGSPDKSLNLPTLQNCFLMFLENPTSDISFEFCTNIN